MNQTVLGNTNQNGKHEATMGWLREVIITLNDGGPVESILIQNREGTPVQYKRS